MQLRWVVLLMAVMIGTGRKAHCEPGTPGYAALVAGALELSELHLETSGIKAMLPLLEPIRFQLLVNGEPLQAITATTTTLLGGSRPATHRVNAAAREATDPPGVIVSTTTLTSTVASIEGIYKATRPQQINESDSGFTFRLPWEQKGYSIQGFTPIPFTAVYAEDTGQYIPAEQLKRMQCRTNSVRGEKLVLRTTGSLELVFSSTSGKPLALHWYMKANSIQFRFWDYDSVPKWRNLTPSEEIPFGLNVEVRSRAKLPDYFPSFATSEGKVDADLTSFYIERSHSWPTAMADWFAWIAPIHSWHGSPFRNRFAEQLLNWNQDPDGYIWTWWDKRGWPFPADDTKSRHFLANSAYVLASEELARWTCDALFEELTYEKSRRAIKYLRDSFGNEDEILVLDLEGHRGRPGQWSSNFYDLHPFGFKDAYVNLYYYAALQRLSRWEEDRGETTASLKLTRIADKMRSSYHESFWDETNGRFIGWIDVARNRRDYGYVFLNLEAIYYGIATREQAIRIFDWLETGVTSSGKADVFTAWKFAPRLTTIHNTDCLTGLWTGEVPYGMQCQNGGTWLHVMFYEIAARAQVFGADDAHRRFMDLMERYGAGDRLCGGPPLIHNEIPQLSYKGHDPSGSVGVDEPFPESGLAPSVFVHVFAGVSATAEGLHFRPCLPYKWEWVKVSGMNYGGIRLDARVSNREVTVSFPDSAGRPPVSRKMDSGEALITRDLLLDEQAQQVAVK